MSDFENLSKSVSALQANVAGLTEELSNVTNSVNQMVHDNSKLLLEENSKLKADIAQMKSVINRQAAYIADLDANLDDMGQYGRRENVVFTNLLQSILDIPCFSGETENARYIEVHGISRN